LQRIVLYIDDLDRCPPQRVVEVLEAVHLMLALDLFIVVVAVDARWLIRSLEYHHRDLFSVKGTGEDDGAGVASPIDYLDKIFQIPYVLFPPEPDATASFLRALLPEPARATTSRPRSAAAFPLGDERPDVGRVWGAETPARASAARVVPESVARRRDLPCPAEGRRRG
jgi:hypothetical protein